MNWMIYGAYGYSGQLIVKEAVAQGMRPILAGRNESATARLAAQYGLSYRCFSLDDVKTVEAGLEGVQLVLHAAGPFSKTYKVMIEGCLLRKSHYLDITGEVEVFEGIFASDFRAKAAGVTFIPGVGFDVVPTDCVAALLKERLPGARKLELAFATKGGVSRGTALTMVEGLDKKGLVRRKGALKLVPNGAFTRKINFGGGLNLDCMSISWGDLSTAFRSTGIENIITYMAASPSQIWTSRLLNVFRPVFKIPFLREMIREEVKRRASGPSANKRMQGYAVVFGEVSDGKKKAKAIAKTCEAYELTARTAVCAVKRLLTSTLPAGAWTPSQVFTPKFLLESIPETSLKLSDVK